MGLLHKKKFVRKALHNKQNYRERGFTLIELLVVIAIIGILSSVVLAALSTAREKAFDAERFSDLYQVKTAVEDYYADNGHYPIAASKFSTCNTAPLTYQSVANNVIPGLAPTYIPSVPIGPQATIGQNSLVDCYIYDSTANGSDYKFYDYDTELISGAKVPSGPLEDPNYLTAAWAVYSPGAVNQSPSL